MQIHTDDQPKIEELFFEFSVHIPPELEDNLADFQDASYLLGLLRGRKEGLNRITQEQARANALLALLTESPY
jgi:hypothetical protein